MKTEMNGAVASLKDTQKQIEALEHMVNTYDELLKQTDKQKSDMRELLDELKARARKQAKELIPECPFKPYDTCFTVSTNGDVLKTKFGITTPLHAYHWQIYSQGNLFRTKEEAKRKRDRRKLLTQFRAFRDKCNGEWKSDWADDTEQKYYVTWSYSQALFVDYEIVLMTLPLFGYFKKKSDAELAIDLFGDEIKRLYVEVE